MQVPAASEAAGTVISTGGETIGRLGRDIEDMGKGTIQRRETIRHAQERGFSSQ